MIASHLIFALPVFLMAAPALSQEVDLSLGLQVNRQLTTGDGFEWDSNILEASLQGAYDEVFFGIDLESVPGDEPDTVEAELTIGYEGSLADGVNWSVAYSRAYLNDSGWNGQEITLDLSMLLSDTLTGSTALIHDPDRTTIDTEIGLGFEPNNRWSFGTLAGWSDEDDVLYGEVSLAFTLNETTAFEVLYEAAEGEDGKLTLSAVFEFGLTGD